MNPPSPALGNTGTRSGPFERPENHTKVCVHHHRSSAAGDSRTYGSVLFGFHAGFGGDALEDTVQGQRFRRGRRGERPAQLPLVHIQNQLRQVNVARLPLGRRVVTFVRQLGQPFLEQSRACTTQRYLRDGNAAQVVGLTSHISLSLSDFSPSNDSLKYPKKNR